MPAPTNTTFLTAIDLGTTLPATATQEVDFAGTTYEVYYSYTAQAADVELGIWAFGDLVTYKPTLSVYIGPASAPTLYLASAGGVFGQNVPVQIPINSPGLQFFFQIAPNGGNPAPANLTLNVQRGPNASTVSAGTIVVPDDTPSFPMVLLDESTGPIKFVPNFAASENGDVLATSGLSLMYSDADSKFNIYNTDFTLKSQVDASWVTAGDSPVRTCQGTQNWFASNKGGGLTHATVRRITPAGVLGTTIGPFASAGLTAIAANNDESLLYYAGNGGSIGSAIKTWTIGTNMAAADLVAGIAGSAVDDIMVLADNTIAALYFRPTAVTNATLKQYNAAGATLQTWVVETPVGSTSPRMAYAIDDPNSVWVWTHTGSSGLSHFRNIRLSDGAVLKFLTTTEFEDGTYVPPANASPVRFGHSFSCPFWLTRAQTISAGTFTTVERVIRRLRRAPHIAQLGQRIYINRFLLDMQTGVGANDVPTTLGHDPVVMLRWSKNGGQTFSDEIEMSAGELGHYFKRVYVWRLGQARDWVFEVTVSDPVSWSLMAAVLDLEPGTN